MKRLLALLLLGLSFHLSYSQAADSSVLAPVIKQLKAYNSRDINAFISCYADTIKVYNYQDQLSFSGIELFKLRYEQLFERYPDLHCTLVNRIAVGNTVVDQESVLFSTSRPRLNAMAIYKVENGVITEVRFVMDR